MPAGLGARREGGGPGRAVAAPALGGRIASRHRVASRFATDRTPLGLHRLGRRLICRQGSRRNDDSITSVRGHCLRRSARCSTPTTDLATLAIGDS